MLKNISLICCGAAAASLSSCLYKFFKYHIEKEALRNTIKGKNEPILNDIMFFTKKSSLCRDHLYEDKVTCKKKHCPVKYLRRIKDHLDAATDTLHVCVFNITCTYLREAIIAAKARGVNVEIITNIAAFSDKRTKVSPYQLKDIKVKCVQDDNDKILMHHKFVVVDCRLLITGSTNWTMSAFFGNFENMIVTNNPEIVVKYKQQFIEMWESLPTNGLHIHRSRSHNVERSRVRKSTRRTAPTKQYFFR